MDDIQHSKKWNSRFDAFLQKVLKLGPSVNFSLSKWIDDCKDLADDTGRQAFMLTFSGGPTKLDHLEMV